MADEAKWYVVHTYSGYENKVASNLEKTIVKCRIVQHQQISTNKIQALLQNMVQRDHPRRCGE